MKRITKLSTIAAITFLFASCSSSQQIVGKGAQGTSYAKELNHHMFFGTVKDDSCNPEEMAGSANDYTVSTKQTFGNIVLAVLTLGIYTPTQTIVTR
ncbi:hypothetical protein FEE95_04465 [Maribacter algarum]|uniref:Bor protein n=1 Tax=Maribacter algarum (ex Zhang et al. 2020) TaxID=2578118 RepID=A0A5S3PUU5_9FLAO|nr:hypothetical protein [Maribacter algarum]TMM58688.1 hypothetical protein FEE95_04465 [Maribacter algarum]